MADRSERMRRQQGTIGGFMRGSTFSAIRNFLFACVLVFAFGRFATMAPLLKVGGGQGRRELGKWPKKRKLVKEGKGNKKLDIVENGVCVSCMMDCVVPDRRIGVGKYLLGWLVLGLVGNVNGLGGKVLGL